MCPIDFTVGGKPGNAPEEPAPAAGPKPFLGVKFTCADDAYNRLYKNSEGTAYAGRCPKCMKEVRIGIGEGGTSSRFFLYDCGRRW
jgi:hypothetical protein